MPSFFLSPNCPVALQQGTYEADGAIPHFIESLAIFQAAGGDDISERRQQIIDNETEQFSHQHSVAELMAARSCARVIVNGNCPFWRLNSDTNRLESRVQRTREPVK
jgi:hypothetical protein